MSKNQVLRYVKEKTYHQNTLPEAVTAQVKKLLTSSIVTGSESNGRRTVALCSMAVIALSESVARGPDVKQRSNQ
eukprot:COSAG05_NODE_8784_length_671_cov_23.027273_1_plen_74_part_01